MRLIPVVAFWLVLLVLGLMLLHPAQDSPDQIQPLPQLALTPFHAKTAWDQKKLNGHVTVLNFFASWCMPCAAEMPELAAFHKQYPHLQLEGIAWNDDPEALEQFLKRHGSPYNAVWIDPDGEATISLGIRGIPETLVVDAAGQVRYRLRGTLTPEIRDTILAPLLTQLLAEADHAH